MKKRKEKREQRKKRKRGNEREGMGRCDEEETPNTLLINLTFPSQDGRTPLHRACLNGHKEVVRYLLERNEIEVNIGDKVWFFLFSFLTFQGRRKEKDRRY